MKRIIASAGFIALGAASLHAGNDMGLSEIERSKPFSVAATLRGFYDDNYVTRSKGLERSSYGFTVSPSLRYNLITDQTALSLGYVYGLTYYDDRKQNSADHTHQADLTLDHKFTAESRLTLSDSFVIAQEPQVLDASGVVAFPLRANGNNMRNVGKIEFNQELSREFGVTIAYQNSFFDYQATGPGSYSALLDRTEHLGSINLRYKLQESTTLSLGYQYGITEYTSKDNLFNLAAPYFSPTLRNNNSHYVFGGLDHYFTPQLHGSIRAGIQFVDYDKLKKNSVSPYADASLTWNYNPGSSIAVGLKHMRNATDVAFFSTTTSPTVDQESTSLYLNLIHKITPMLTGSVLAQYQNSKFKGGDVNGLADDFYGIGTMLSYQINQYLAAEVGYNYDRLESKLALRGFDRNRAFIGIRANY